MSNNKCAACGKTAYPLESVAAIGNFYHKGCFKCSVCNTTVNLKNFKGLEGKIYCLTHTPKPKSSVIVDSVTMKTARSAPKSDVTKGIHKADPKVAPKHSGDFTPNAVGDQSTENAPESSNISYDAPPADQSRENNPETSGIQYDQQNPDQSTENAPEAGNVQYDQYNPDQSTEN